MPLLHSAEPVPPVRCVRAFEIKDSRSAALHLGYMNGNRSDTRLLAHLLHYLTDRSRQKFTIQASKVLSMAADTFAWRPETRSEPWIIVYSSIM